jgi:hypothetical protein
MAGWAARRPVGCSGCFLPPSILVTATVGAAAGTVSGHLWPGGVALGREGTGRCARLGQSALLLIGRRRVRSALEELHLKADWHITEELGASTKGIDAAVVQAASEPAVPGPGAVRS